MIKQGGSLRDRVLPLNPEEAVKAFQDLGATFAFGIHWGTFKLTLEKMDEPPFRLKSALEGEGISEEVFRVLTHGETWSESLLRYQFHIKISIAVS